MSADEVIVRLVIRSQDLSPEEITHAIGLPCEQSWVTGQRRGPTIILHEDNGWIIGSGLARTSALEDQVDGLLRRLAPVSSKVKELSARNIVEVSIVIYAGNEPALSFGNQTLRALAGMGASLDIDLYIMRDD